MAWDHLDIDKPHLAYMILGGFTGLFMLCSLFVKEKLYIGEATVATLCGIIFGPHAANLFNPMSWGNVDKITLECSRIVLVVQCFAVGVELPKAYMERHWKSVVLLLVPVMTWGWLATSLFIWWMVPPLDWLESLVCAACVTATDPVLASSVVGKGKFAKRVPKHLRDLLSAESGCNDGMAFPFIYLGYYIWRYRPDGGKVSLNWFCVTILYECVLGAIFGFILGYFARHAIRFAENHQLVDRESFLVFYFVLAVFCAGSGSLLGMDDLLMGFSAGVGFSNDGWFTEKTEESHVSNVIDLLLNLAYFVYFGSIVPWQEYNNHAIGLVPWRLVVIAILVIFFRRIPIMLALKPIIPDVKTWREALFAGHFGPIGVGAVFASIMARAELEGSDTEPLGAAERPHPGASNYYIVQLIWPITTFLIISSILVHGSSIAVFTLGKRINTMTVTLSYTTANEEGPSWMNRLPRMQSLGKGSMSLRKQDDMDDSSESAPGTLPPIGVPGNFLRRVREDDSDAQTANLPARRPRRRRRRQDSAGGPISQSAIAPRTQLDAQRDEEEKRDRSETDLRDTIEREGETATKERDRYGREPQLEVYKEGNKLVVEDAEGNVVSTENISHMSPEEQDEHIEAQRMRLMQDTSGKLSKSRSEPHADTEGEDVKHAVESGTGHPYDKARKAFGKWLGLGKHRETEKPETKPVSQKAGKRGQRSAHAYQFGNTVIVEDEDGEVIKKYDIAAPTKANQAPEQQSEANKNPIRRGLTRMGTWLGNQTDGEASKAAQTRAAEEDDDGLRFTVAQNDDIGRSGVDHKGHRMNKNEFIRQIQKIPFKSRRGFVEETDAPEKVKDAARDQSDARAYEERQQAQEDQTAPGRSSTQKQPPTAMIPPLGISDTDTESLTEDDDEGDSSESSGQHDVAASLARFQSGTPAQARRSRLSSQSEYPPMRTRRDSEDDGTERIPPSRGGGGATTGTRDTTTTSSPTLQAQTAAADNGETAVERRRRMAALGQLDEDLTDSDEPEEKGSRDSDSEDYGGFRPVRGRVQFADGTRPAASRPGAGIVSYNNSRNRDRDGDQSRHHDGDDSSDGNGNGDSPSRLDPDRDPRPHVSWGGETGRDS